jgi:hypothetical protein
MESERSLKEVFLSFCSIGKSEMSNKEYAKLNKDCGLLDKKYTTTDVDIYFTKIKDKSSKVITYDQFNEGLKLAATKKGITYDDIVSKIRSAGGPSFTGTKAEYVKFHDDKNLYTGVYAKGGPTNVDKQNVHDIAQTCDRTSADVRGVKK